MSTFTAASACNQSPLADALILLIVKAHQSKLHKPQPGQYISFEVHFKAVKRLNGFENSANIESTKHSNQYLTTASVHWAIG